MKLTLMLVVHEIFNCFVLSLTIAQYERYAHIDILSEQDKLLS